MTTVLSIWFKKMAEDSKENVVQSSKTCQSLTQIQNDGQTDRQTVTIDNRDNVSQLYLHIKK